MRKRIKWLITAAVLLVAAGAGCYNLLRTPAAEEGAGGAGPRCQGRRASCQRARDPSAASDRRHFHDQYPAADEEVDLSFETSGKIVSIDFEEGTPVKKGQLLAKVNDMPLQAQLSKYKAQVKLAEDRVYRQSTLLEKDAVSQEAYEQARTELATLNADIELCEANIALTELRAPFDGIIGLRPRQRGGLCVAYGLWLPKLTPHRSAQDRVRRARALCVRDQAGNTALLYRRGSLETFRAKVYAVDPNVDEQSRTLSVRALYPNDGQHLFPGRFASILHTGQRYTRASPFRPRPVVPRDGRRQGLPL